MSISPGNINKLNKIAGISSVINVNATNYATYANTVFKANLLIVKNMNSQSAVGVGIAKTNVKIGTTGSANTFGWLNHNAPNKTNGTTAICCLGIEDLWGNVFAVEDGIIKAASTNTISMAQYADQYNSDGTGYEVVANIGTYKNGNPCYPKRFLGLPKFIFAPDLSLEPTSGYDIAYVDTNETTVSRVGGYYASGNSWGQNGILRRDFWDSATGISDYMCTRLVYKHVQEGCYDIKGNY